MRSKFTGKIHTMDLPVTEEQIKQWQEGTTLIQNAFPQLSAEEREILLTGSTREEWDNIFGALK